MFDLLTGDKLINTEVNEKAPATPSACTRGGRVLRERKLDNP
jgi:hypothetical protein